MYLTMVNFWDIKSTPIKNVIVFLAVVLISFSNLNEAFGQNEDTITDFYEYANKEWFDSTIVLENTAVVNNWGILWDKIIDKSIEILSGDFKYGLDENHHYVLNQLQNFYKSTIEFSDDGRKRVELVQKHYPMLFGILFSQVTVSKRKEEKIKEIIKYINIAFGQKIKNSDKLGNYYKDFFLSKLDRMKFEIGSPNLSSFPKMPILSEDSLEKNIQLSVEYQLDENIKNTDWKVPPFETYCSYSFHSNKVKLNAGIIYDSYFTEENDFIYLFATIGRTIGHEMTHAFDNIGKDYNENGEYINWFEKFISGELFAKNDLDNIYNPIINQYNQYTIQDSLFVNGESTLQENIADLGGIEISLFALKLNLKDKFSLLSDEDNSKMIKKFFITYAQFWREKATSEFERSSLKRLHTPQKFRAIGPVYNQDEFYEVFEIDKKSKFYIPVDLRVSIW